MRGVCLCSCSRRLYTSLLCWAASTYLRKCLQGWIGNVFLKSLFGTELIQETAKWCSGLMPADQKWSPPESRQDQLVDEKLWRQLYRGFYFDSVCCFPPRLSCQIKSTVWFNQKPTQEVQLPEQIIVIYCNLRWQRSPAGLCRSRKFIRDSQCWFRLLNTCTTNIYWIIWILNLDCDKYCIFCYFW